MSEKLIYPLSPLRRVPTKNLLKDIVNLIEILKEISVFCNILTRRVIGFTKNFI